MYYNAIQSALTSLIKIIAIAGFTGIAVHAMWTQHKNWMATYCPPVKPYTPDTQTEVEANATEPAPQPAEQPQQLEAAEDAWELRTTTSSPRYWVRQPGSTKPVLMLMPPKEEAKPTKKTRQPANKPVNKAPKTPTKPRTTNRKRKTA